MYTNKVYIIIKKHQETMNKTRQIHKQIRRIHKILYKNYGVQGWWPVTDKESKRPTYKKRKKLSRNQRFEIIIGAILTQNTAWKNVEKTIIELNKKKLLDIHKIKALPLKKLSKLIKPTGYYNQKAKKIKAMIDFLKSGKEINRENLLSVWGVGPETADSILLYAYNKPFFVIDTYTKRILARMGLVKSNVSYNELQHMFHKALPRNTELFKEYHALLVEHAKKYCRTKPLCDECVLKEECKIKRSKQ